MHQTNQHVCYCVILMCFSLFLPLRRSFSCKVIQQQVLWDISSSKSPRVRASSRNLESDPAQQESRPTNGSTEFLSETPRQQSRQMQHTRTKAIVEFYLSQTSHAQLNAWMWKFVFLNLLNKHFYIESFNEGLYIPVWLVFVLSLINVYVQNVYNF